MVVLFSETKFTTQELIESHRIQTQQLQLKSPICFTTENVTYKIERDSQTQRRYLWLQRGRTGARNNLRVCNEHVYIAIFKMDNQQETTVQHTELFSMLCGSLDDRGVWRMDNVYVWLSPLCYLPETIAKLLLAQVARIHRRTTQKRSS